MAVIKTIFKIIASLEHALAKITNLTYNEVNIIIYYLIIPLSWTILIDCIIKIPIISPLFICLWIYIIYKAHKYFSKWCDKGFNKSVDFLLWFKRVGWNYTLSSVIICVFFPIIIYGSLIYML